MNPIFATLQEQFDKAKFAKMNILDSVENRRIAMQYGVMGTPTIKVFCNGRTVGEVVGFRPLDRLVSDLKEIIDRKEDCLGQSTPIE